MTLPYGLIIAGGEGSRLGGVRKGDLRVGGIPMIERVAATLGPVALPLMVATGPGPYAGTLPDGAVGLSDAALDHQGPLAGLAAAVSWLRARGAVEGVLLTAAVDAPLLPDDYADRLIQALEGAPVAYAAWGDTFYPTNAAWRLEAIADLPDWLAEADAPNSPKSLIRRIGGMAVDWLLPGLENPFANVNTIADLLALERLARG